MKQQSLSHLIEELRTSKAELEAQNTALEYSRIAAEGASERFESLFAKVPLALMVVDEFGMVEQSNAMALRLFRPQESDPPLNFLLPVVTSDHAVRVQAALDEARLHGHSQSTEVVFSGGAQGRFTGDLHIARIEYSSHKDLTQLICAVIDQTPLLEKRHALQQRNEELRRSENRLAAIINSSLDAIVCVDEAQHITVFNPAAATLFACPAQQAFQTPLARFLPDVMDSIAATPPSSSTLLGEVNGLTADGRALMLEVSVSREYQADGGGEVITLFARDLTLRKQMEDQLRKAHKMQAIGTMAGGIAHDFNNILGAILGNASLARQDASSDSPAQLSLVEIEKAGRRGRDLVRQILTFSRNEAPVRHPIQLADVVNDALHLLKMTVPPNIDINTRLQTAPAVLADATQIEQALVNLCTNAIHAIGPARGTVHIELNACAPDPVLAQRLRLSPGSYVTLAVRDTGSGMDCDTLERIFEPFFTTKPVGQGTGLGLAVVHGVMRTHLGTVDVSSAPGEGSTFTLYFPAADIVAGPKPAEPAQAQIVMDSGHHVMYVDDDQALAFLVKRALERRGFRLSVYNDPQEALAALREQPQAFDLLVTDYNMPGFSGVEVLIEARQIRPELPMALASGYVTPEIEAQARAAGAQDLIYKPNDVAELCDTVQRLIQGERQH